MAQGIYAVCSWSSHFGIALKKLLVIFHSVDKTISVYGSKKPKCVIDAHSMVLYCHLFRLCISLLMLEAREVHVGVHVYFLLDIFNLQVQSVQKLCLYGWKNGRGVCCFVQDLFRGNQWHVHIHVGFYQLQSRNQVTTCTAYMHKYDRSCLQRPIYWQ